MKRRRPARRQELDADAANAEGSSNATGAANFRISAAHHRHQCKAAAHLRQIARSDRAVRSHERSSVVQYDAQQRTVDLERELAVVFMKPSFLNLFRKKFTRERVVPIISASVSCEIFGATRSGLSCLPYRASSNRARAKRFSLELKS